MKNAERRWIIVDSTGKRHGIPMPKDQAEQQARQLSETALRESKNGKATTFSLREHLIE